MNREAYKAWLAANANSPTTINTRTATNVKLEKSLIELGLPYGDLEAAWESDRFEAIYGVLAHLLQDIRDGGDEYRILAPDTTIPEKRIYAHRTHLKNYSLFLQDQERGLERSDWKQLEWLRNGFLERATDFQSFSQTTGVYFDTERAYKDEIRERITAIVASGATSRTVGLELHQALEPKSGAFLRWQTRDAIEKGDAELADAFFVTIGELATADSPGPDAIFSAVESFSELAERGLTVLTPGETWATALTVAGFVRPDLSAPFKVSVARQLGKYLVDDTIFGWGRPKRSELEQWLELLNRIRDVMRDVWQWQPRDLFDVQGFVWMARESLSPVDEAEEAPLAELDVEERAAANPVNVIFHGPPGTGKTYLTAEEAVRLCDGTSPGSHAEALRRYDELRRSGQVAFITFHQSYAYEDFVEGLRPVSGEADSGAGFKLEPRLGAFREICALAEQARQAAGAPSGFELGTRRVFKMSLGKAYEEEHIYETCIEEEYVGLGWGGTVDWSDPKYQDFEEVKQRWQQIAPEASGNSSDIAQAWRFREMKEGDLIVVSQGNQIFRAIGEVVGPYYYAEDAEETYHHRRKVRWLRILDEPLQVAHIYDKAFTQKSCYQLKDQYLKREALTRLLGGTKDEGGQPDQFVLIIDEINRANVSKVFGELITLIEPDKRLGQRNALSVRLPYTGDTFGVPDNLHIIGTMNTADRSIALLDTALRRRFEFREMMPRPELLHDARTQCGVDLIGLLETINRRIEYLFDREHQIGHAYFMSCRSKGDVDAVMRHKIIPLLCEYFYEDWEKVALVLGDAKGEGRFLEMTVLPPPPGVEDMPSEAVSRWMLKARFADDAYDSFG